MFYFSDIYRKLAAECDKDIYSSRQIKIPFPQFVVFYNGTKEQPERQVLHLHNAFPNGINREDAALDCHAVVLNINCGHNKSIMKRCRKLEEYSLFIGRVREYAGQKTSIKEAIDLAVEDCIKEGILEKILKENREEVCSMLLTEYDEQSHIESEKEIAREEGREEGIQEGIHMVALLAECLERDGRLQDLKLLSDAKVRGRLFREYHIIKD